MLYTSEVGKLYHPDVTRWPETAQYNFRNSAHELVLYCAALKRREIEAVKSGPSQFALYVPGPDVLFLLSNFGTLWFESPFSIRRLPESERGPGHELPTPESRSLLNLTLVDADTGIIHALKAITFSPKFSRALNSAIDAQLAHPTTISEMDAAIADAYHRCPTLESMVTAASVRCRGGE